MTESFQYPPDVFTLVTDVVPLLCRSKKDVVLFFKGAGVMATELAPIEEKLRSNPKEINKYEISRTILTSVNSKGDSCLAVRREILKRIVEFEDFSMCWPDDQFKAKGMVADIKKIVNVKDSFTRMKQERNSERQEAAQKRRAELAAEVQKRRNVEAISKSLSELFSMDSRPQERGKLLERVLNDLFRAFGILVREDFHRRDPDYPTVLEQIDGVIELDGIIHLVEMKWLNVPIGMAEFSQHMVRLFGRSDARGIFISSSSYTAPVLKECASFLSQKTMFLCSLQEIVMLLQREGDLLEFLRKKAQAAIVEKNPFIEILT